MLADAEFTPDLPPMLHGIPEPTQAIDSLNRALDKMIDRFTTYVSHLLIRSVCKKKKID